LAKGYIVKEMYIDQGLLPMEISRRLRVPIQEIRKIIVKIKREIKKKEIEPIIVKKKTDTLRENK
jgi:hypothetical protein